MKEEVLLDLESKMPDPFPHTRNSYTKRILEILNNIKKLDEETKRVISSTRLIQKEITFLTGRVQRSFSLAEETLFSSAKKSCEDSSAKKNSEDSFEKKCYRLLAQVHQETTRLSQGIESSGVLRRELIGLEESVKKQQDMGIDSKVQQIQNDILQLRQSNKAILDDKN